MVDMKVNLLGAPRFERDGKSIYIKRRKALALFAYLAVTGKPHSRDSLAVLFWPEHDQSEARAGLRRELSRLKRDFGEEILLIERELVSLQPGAQVELDVRRFQELVKFAQNHTHIQDESREPSVCAECYQSSAEAVELYDGDFMAGFSLGDSPQFDDWQFFEGESLRQSLAESLQKLIEWHQLQGEYERAIEYARRWLSLDTLHEEAHRQLMELYARAGQYAAAVRQYQECVRLLREEIGVEPEQETQDLYENIRLRKLGATAASSKTSILPNTNTSPPVIHEQKIDYCTGFDGVRIAYAQVGEGPVFVKTATWLSHLEYDWNSPVWRHWLVELAHGHTLVRFDERGCGLSDWDVEEFSQEAFVHDLESVVDHIGLERFPLLGISGGGPAAIAYAVRHPEKVSHLILYGTYAHGRLHRGYSRKDLELAEMVLNMIRLGWGQDNPAFRQFFTSMFMPEASAEQMHWYNDLQRMSTSPENAYRLEQTFFQQDVSNIAAQIKVPTLVLHAPEDGIVPFEEGRWLAETIPGARFVHLDSKNHILLEDEPAWGVFLHEVRSFLATESPVISTPDVVAGVHRDVGFRGPAEARDAGKPAFVYLDEEPRFRAEDPSRVAEDSSPDSVEAVAVGVVRNLPKHQTPFIGRNLELMEIQQHLLEDPDCRLLTILGPGGMGKTRVASETAARMGEYFKDGVFFIPLRSISDPELIIPAVSDVLEIGPSATDDPLAKLLDHLQDKEILLVLDNFEHVLDAALVLIDILDHAPGIKLLVTSRHALSVYGELVYPLSGLPYPQDTEFTQNESYGSVQLFAEHASRVRRGFSLSENLRAVMRICRLVEGIPLAIELAASWSRTLSPDQIAAEIQSNIEFLATRMRNVEEGHRSMQAVFDQSWSLLTRAEQSVFMRLSVFRGGFVPDAAKQVAAASLMVLSSLADKSLVRIEANGRYQIHELLRQFGEERMASAREEFDRLRDLHCSYYSDYVHQRLPGLVGGNQQQNLSEIMDEIHNIRAAWQWAIDQHNLPAIQDLLHGLDAYLQYQSRYLEGIKVFEKASSSIQPLEESNDRDYILAQLLDYQGWFNVRLGQLDQAAQAFEVSHSLYKQLSPELSPPLGIATDPLIGITLVTTMSGNYDQAISIGEQARENNLALDDRRNLTFTYYTLISAYLAKGEFDLAHQSAERAFKLAEEYQDHWFMAYVLNEWGNVSRAMGRYSEAKDRYLSSYDIRESFNDPEGMAVALYHLGRIAVLEHEYLEAKGLYQHSLSIYQEISDQGGLASSLAGLGEVSCHLGDIESARQHLIDALQISGEMQHIPLTLTILICIAELYWQSGNPERAIEILSFVNSSDASDKETREQASTLLDRYKSGLPGYQFTTLQKRGESYNLDDLTQAVFTELSPVDAVEVE